MKRAKPRSRQAVKRGSPIITITIIIIGGGTIITTTIIIIGGGTIITTPITTTRIAPPGGSDPPPAIDASGAIASS